MYAPSSASYITSSTQAGMLPVAQPTISPNGAVAVTASQVIDYNAAYQAGAIPAMAGYEAVAAQYANAYMNPAAYTYGVPQPMGLAAATHYQPQQIQERMQ